MDRNYYYFDADIVSMGRVWALAMIFHRANRSFFASLCKHQIPLIAEDLYLSTMKEFYKL